jgi:heptaprenyl diphosphate synthase
VLEGFGEALGLAFQLSDDIMDLTASHQTLGKEPGQDLREGVYTLPVLHALAGPDGAELRGLLAGGPPGGEGLARALAIVAEPANLAHAREAVVAEVDRARALAARLPEGPANTALAQLAEFLAARCQARGPADPGAPRAAVPEARS